jgi:hypothetical protein
MTPHESLVRWTATIHTLSPARRFCSWLTNHLSPNVLLDTYSIMAIILVNFG